MDSCSGKYSYIQALGMNYKTFPFGFGLEFNIMILGDSLF